MNVMNTLCQEMQDRLNIANDKTVTLLEQTDALREQRYIYPSPRTYRLGNELVQNAFQRNTSS